MDPGDYVVMPVVKGRAVWPVVRRPGPCATPGCGDPEAVHELGKRDGRLVRTYCSRNGCGCTSYTEPQMLPPCPTCGQEVPGA